MLRNGNDRHINRPRHHRSAWPLAVAAVIVGGNAVTRGDDDANRPRSEPRSHIQPVSEMATARPAADASASATVTSPYGLVVTRVSDLLREHLTLGHGVGLVVNEVVAESSAAAVGFKQHDVLVSIDEQMLIVPEQLVVLLAGKGAAAPKSCTLIRNGQRQTIALSASSPLVSAAGSLSPKPKPALTPTASALAVLPRPKNEPAVATEQAEKKTTGIVRRKGDKGFVLADREYAIEVTREDETLLTVRDSHGKTIFRNVIETPEQRSRIPLAVRDRVEQLERQLDPQMQATARPQPVAEIGSLGIEPVQIK